MQGCSGGGGGDDTLWTLVGPISAMSATANPSRLCSRLWHHLNRAGRIPWKEAVRRHSICCNKRRRRAEFAHKKHFELLKAGAVGEGGHTQ